MKTSRTLQSALELEAANQVTDRRQDVGGLRFKSVRHALRWYFEMQVKLQSPQAMHPRGERASDGSLVIVRTQGGKGGDFDEVLATMATIGKGLAQLEAYFPRGHHIVVLCEREGWNHRRISEALDWSVGKVSAWRGQAEAFLAGLWSQGGLLKG